MKMLKSRRSSAPAAALLVIIAFLAAPFARAQSGKPVPGELKVPPGKESQSSSDATATGKGEGKEKDKGKDDDKEPPPSVTEHTLNVGGKTIRYRATTGFMVMRDWTEKKKTEDGEAGPRGSSPAASPAKDDKSKDKDGKDDQPKQK